MMKSPMLLNATFFFLFVLLGQTRPPSRAINLFDVDGNPIRSGVTYYMLPMASGRGGGPTLAKTGSDTCPLTVVQDANSTSPGFPVRLSDAEDVYYVAEGYPV
ncbi:hypothetical protein L6164_013283 [Bauhinia variegata]|uniref:Uncharacterized protein n=1 Tax=Bauhinia variegata TaxID=167791 RepID=A0ACB9PBL2_BAUVA|nr:hypothetical protein L6164_013283 [Bauhinia variegata]